MLGEYVIGHGEALVAGEADPGRFRIVRADLAIERLVDLDPAPAAAQLEKLGRLALRCEEIFGEALDIEWAIDPAGEVQLVQARPLTAPLPENGADSNEVKAGPQVVWSNANVNENFPGPVTPLLYSVAATGYAHYFRNLAVAFGVSAARIRRLEPAFAQVIGVHAGRIYYHLSHIHRILRGVPGGEFLARSFDDFVGAEATAAEAPPPTRAHEVLVMAWRVFGQYRQVGRRVAAFEARIEEFCRRWPIEDLAKRPASDLREGLRRFLEIRRHQWNDAALADAAAMVCYGLLGRWLKRLHPGDPGLLHDLLKGLPELVSGHPPRDLWALAETVRAQPAAAALFVTSNVAESDDGALLGALEREPALASVATAFADYQRRWGFRRSGELMLTEPGLDERPGELLDLLRAYLRRSGEPSPAELLAEQRRSRLARTAALGEGQRGWRRLQLPLLRRLVAATQGAVALRERARLQQARLYNRLRHLALAIGRQWTDEGQLDRPEDVFFFAAGELDELLGGGAMFGAPAETAAVARQRRVLHQGHQAQAPPPDQLVLPVGASWRGEATVAAAPVTAPGGHFVGIGAGSGVAVGRPRVLRDLGEAKLLAQGDILVTRQTDPGWAALFPLIRGLVLERGGLLSHGAIIAREYGIPCVVGIRGAVAALGEVAQVRVDGNRGTVDVLG